MEIDYLPVYPPLHLDHLERLTDCTGIIQHALHSVPDPTHGYSIDDQARALIVLLAHANLTGAKHPPRLAYTYMSFLKHAANPDGTFHNFLSYGRQWLDEQGSEDSHGRALWSLGYATRYGLERGMIGAAGDLFDVGKAHIEKLQWSRSWAFSLFGIYHRLKAAPDDDLLTLTRTLAEKLVDCYDTVSSPDWLWFEDELTYCNAKLPAALLLAYELTSETRYLEVGTASLAWLADILINEDSELRLVGQNGWYTRGGVKAGFDEQCVDAQGLIEAAVIAARVTGQTSWHRPAIVAFDWFMGRNVHGVSLIDPVTWGCFDGITEARLNRNMGAESIVCYLLAYLELVGAGILTLEGAVPQPVRDL
jgi:hypothetical protein